MVAIFCTCALCLPADSRAAVDSRGQTCAAQTIEDLECDLDSIVNAITTPGAAVAIVSADSIIWIGTFGYADIEAGKPVTEETQFCIGSCTKSFVGLGFLKLLDEHRIDLNTPVKDVVPEIEIGNPWEDTHPVRIIHLLEHTAGFDDSHPNWFYFKGPLLPLRQALEMKAHLRKVRWPPGTRFSYSSAGFTLAGYILEKVTGMRYEDYLKQEVLGPIGMKASSIGSSAEARKLLAVGYDRNQRSFPTWYDYDEPAGAMNSSITEMALFVQFLLRRGTVGDTQIISPEQFDRIGRPVSTLASRAGLKSGYSFGVGTSYRSGTRWLSHGGAVPGFLAEYALSPEDNLGYVVLQNSFDVSFFDDVFTRVRSYANYLADSLAPPLTPAISAEELKTFCGYYEPRSPRLQITRLVEVLTGGVTILCEHDTLYTQSLLSEKEPLIPVDHNLFRRPWHPEATSAFTRSDHGQMVYASRNEYFERIPVWRAYVYRILFFGALLIAISSILYALFWVPAHLYKKIRHLDTRSKYLSMRLVPLLAVLSLILGTWKLGDQTILELGMLTVPNVLFFMSTLIFAGLSTLSMFTTYRSFFKPVKEVARVYAVFLSLSCFGLTLYLSYWGVIGLRLWSY